jgi:predicted Mrr-cat superfamily restriction endonuclease
MVSPPGADRGVDVLASKDRLGFEEPRIKAEVKHRRNTSMVQKRYEALLLDFVQEIGVYM